MRRLRHGPQRRSADVWRQHYLKYRRKGWSEDQAARKAFELEDKHYRKLRMKQLTPQQRRDLSSLHHRRHSNTSPGCLVYGTLIVLGTTLVLTLWAYYRGVV